MSLLRSKEIHATLQMPLNAAIHSKGFAATGTKNAWGVVVSSSKRKYGQYAQMDTQFIFFLILFFFSFFFSFFLLFSCTDFQIFCIIMQYIVHLCT